jgi:superoxide dismutase, Fe-Mn family
MHHQVREFDLARVRRIWDRAIELHLALYAGYVEQLNKLLGSNGRGSQGRTVGPEAWARRFAFEYNGVVLHESYFEALSGPAKPLDRGGALGRALDNSFGGYAGWHADALELATVRGIGWIALVRGPVAGRLHNIWIDEHQLSVAASVDVLLVLDMWEHAWLLDYAPKDRGRFVSDVIDQLNWSVIEGRYGGAEQLRRSA